MNWGNNLHVKLYWKFLKVDTILKKDISYENGIWNLAPKQEKMVAHKGQRYANQELVLDSETIQQTN